MGELVFLKLGGSLITDKRKSKCARIEVIRRIASEIADARRRIPALQLLIGHGSGSFGHFTAAKYQVRAGYPDCWFGYAATSAVVQELNRLVIDALLVEGIPAVPVQPSATAVCEEGELKQIDSRVTARLLQNGVVPVIYGDVAIDLVQGCTIVSTEQLFCALAPVLKPHRVILAGEVDGVFDADPRLNLQAHLLTEITEAAYPQLESGMRGASGIDVTGGMASKVHLMLTLVRDMPNLTIRLVSGLVPGLLTQVLIDPGYQAGTLLRR